VLCLFHSRANSGTFNQPGIILPGETGANLPSAAERLVTTREALRFELLTEAKAEFRDHHTEAEVREHIRSDPDRYEFTDTDPVESLRKLSIPGLWLFGGRDVSVPAEISIERLRMLSANGKPFEYQLFPEADHQLVENTALPIIVDWIHKTAGRR
jgi:uncharacterized protein